MNSADLDLALDYFGKYPRLERIAAEKQEKRINDAALAAYANLKRWEGEYRPHPEPTLGGSVYLSPAARSFTKERSGTPGRKKESVVLLAASLGISAAVGLAVWFAEWLTA